MNRVQLLDLPPDWLGSLSLAPERDRLGHLPLTNLFGTCSKLQQMIFTQPAIRPMLRVKPADIEHKGGHLHFQALAMAEAAGARLHLELENMGALKTGPSKAALGLLLTGAALLHRERQPGKPAASVSLNCITAATRTPDEEGEVVLSSVVPDVLVQHCPNLNQLSLSVATVADEGNALQLTCTSLQELTLWDVRGVNTDWFKQQLLNLPSLTVLYLCGAGIRREYEEGGVFWAVISRYSSQLRGLTCKWEERHGEHLSALPWSPTTHLPALQELYLELALKGDAALQQLLQSAPDVKRLSLYSISGLSSSFAQVPCSWRELTLRDMYAAELSKLPLSSCTGLMCSARLRLSDLGQAKQPTAEQITAGVQAAQAAGGLQFERDISINLSTDDLERLTAAAPLVQRLNGSTRVQMHKPGSKQNAPWSDRRPLLATLGQHLRCRELRFGIYDWAANPVAAAQLPDLLPHVEGFSGWSLPDGDVLQMVRSASRPFILLVYQHKKEQLQQAMQEAGHQLVTFECC